MDDVLYTIPGPKTMFEMTWEEVSEALKETDTVILAVGSTEQHGPHLPLGTDAMQANEMAKRTAKKLAEEGIKVLVGPTIPFGCAPYHMGFPGTINLRSTTLHAVIKDVCLSLYQHGFRKFALLLGHGGNYGPMMVAAQDIVDETDAEVIVLNWIKEMMEKYRGILTSNDAEGHSGEGETSRQLALHPELVQLRRARVLYSKKAEEMESNDHPLLGGGVFPASKSFKVATQWGSVGNPNLAKKETGDKSYDVIASWSAAKIKKQWFR
jgi:creatinine amidohydrolase